MLSLIVLFYLILAFVNLFFQHVKAVLKMKPVKQETSFLLQKIVRYLGIPLKIVKILPTGKFSLDSNRKRGHYKCHKTPLYF